MTDTAGYGKNRGADLGGRHADLFDHDRGGGGPTPVPVPLPPIQKADAVYRPRHPATPPTRRTRCTRLLRLAEMIEKIHEIDCPETRSLIVMITKSKAIDLYRKKSGGQGTVPLEDWAAAAPPQAEGVGRGTGWPGPLQPCPA